MCWVQGVYYLITGLWPLVHVRSFKMVTGDKGKTDNLQTGQDIDHWLLMTVAVLITSIAIALLFGAVRKSQSAELAVLAVVSAIGLTGIDLLYTARDIILPVYLIDAVAEVLLITGWTVALVARRRKRPETHTAA